MSFYLKDPQARVDYAIDWSPYLDGQTIEASLWFVVPDEAGGIAAEESSFEPGRTAARLAGGHAGHIYSVSNQVTLSDGTTDIRSLTLRVEAR
jgi:pyruvoyl-dependent arginine decarboxylase (PvlArgDC)